MTILYYTTTPFPNGGMASGNRISHTSKCLSANGCTVIVCTPFSDSGRSERMIIDGVKFQSFCSRNTSLWVQRLSMYFQYPFLVYKLLRGIADKDRCVHVYTTSIWQMFCAWLIARLTKCKITREGTEIPYTLFGNYSWFSRFMEIKLLLKTYDGVVSITKNLFEYYSNACKKNCRHVHIPMTVDCDRFQDEHRSSPFPFDYIAYTGTMQRNGGGVDVLVKSFGYVATKNQTQHLILIGNGTDAIKSQLLDLVDPNIGQRIHFLFGGQIPSSEMPCYIKNAKILAMLPLPTKQQEGCFPTKLGEYLASGVPCVVSKVGIPPQYLTDGVNVRFVPSGDPQATAEVMLDILYNYDKALKIAANGRQYARENFHYENFGKKLSDWFKEITSINLK